jgi:hypothetical protein
MWDNFLYYFEAYLNLTLDQPAPTHQPYPSGQYDAYNPQLQAQHDSGFNPETYNNIALLAAAGVAAHPTNQYSSPPPAQHADRNYTLGGGNYDSSYEANQVLDHTRHDDNQYFPSPHENTYQLSSSPGPINTNVAAMPIPGPAITSPVKGPRGVGSPVHQYSDSPPSYDHPSQSSGAWREKH